MKFKKSSLERVAENLAKDALWYSKRYGCSVVEAIADRDYPATRAEIVRALEICQVQISEDRVRVCRPSTVDQLDRYLREESEGFDPRPGELGYSY